MARLRLGRWASGLAAVIAVPMLISCGGEEAAETTTGARDTTGTGAAEATTTETR